MNDAYSVIAEYYDELMNDFDYDGYYDFVKDNLYGDVLEFACGSGNFTSRIAKNAKSVIATDISAEMLSKAINNNLKNRRTVKFLKSDMKFFHSENKFDSIICVCDGINYIPQSETERLFMNIYNLLNDNGSFIFDISSEFKLTDKIGNNTFYEDNDDLTYLWTNDLHNEYVTMSLTFFIRENDKYIRHDEEHTQYIHKTDILTKQLDKVGFQTELYDGISFRALNDYSERLLFISKKLKRD